MQLPYRVGLIELIRLINANGGIGATQGAGPKGDKGDKGDTGSQGMIGPPRPSGIKGDTGLQGTIGLTGPAGPTLTFAIGSASTLALLLGTQQDVTITLDKTMPNTTYNVFPIPGTSLVGSSILKVKTKTTTNVVITVKANLALSVGSITILAIG